MFADSSPQELRHFEVRIAEQGRDAEGRGEHLSQEGTAAVAEQQIGLFGVEERADEAQRLLGMKWQIGREHVGAPLESPPQSPSHSTTASSKKSMQK